MTAHPADSVRAEAQRYGIGRILTKPFSMAELQTELQATAAEFCVKCWSAAVRSDVENTAMARGNTASPPLWDRTVRHRNGVVGSKTMFDAGLESC